MADRKKILLFEALRALLISVCCVGAVARAEVSPLCEDLARFSCAPGSFKDATGAVKSASEFQRSLTAWGEKSRLQVNEKFKKILENPENAYFQELAVAGLGLKNSPQCSSSVPSDVSACRENVVEGLTLLAQKQALLPLMSLPVMNRMSSLSDTTYILQNEVYQGVVRDLNKQLEADLSNPDMEGKIKDKIFPGVKELMVERIGELSIPEEQKKFMINKIRSIQFAGTNCSEIGGPYKDGPAISSLLVPNAFYNAGRNIFKFCSGFLLQSTSEFQIAKIIGHELSHAIDPCLIAFGPTDMGFKYKNSVSLQKMEQEFPFRNVLSCLRDPRSIEAKNLNRDPLLAPSAGQVGSGYPSPPGGRPAPTPGGTQGGMGQGPGPKPASFCGEDQITESFSDWLGVEILPRYIEKNFKLTPEQYREGYANANRLDCWTYPDTSDNFNSEPHPAIGKRINKILLVNPKVRGQMGCPPSHSEWVYCDSEKALLPPSQTGDQGSEDRLKDFSPVPVDEEEGGFR